VGPAEPVEPAEGPTRAGGASYGHSDDLGELGEGVSDLGDRRPIGALRALVFGVGVVVLGVGVQVGHLVVDLAEHGFEVVERCDVPGGPSDTGGCLDRPGGSRSGFGTLRSGCETLRAQPGLFGIERCGHLGIFGSQVGGGLGEESIGVQGRCGLGSAPRGSPGGGACVGGQLGGGRAETLAFGLVGSGVGCSVGGETHSRPVGQGDFEVCVGAVIDMLGQGVEVRIGVDVGTFGLEWSPDGLGPHLAVVVYEMTRGILRVADHRDDPSPLRPFAPPTHRLVRFPPSSGSTPPTAGHLPRCCLIPTRTSSLITCSRAAHRQGNVPPPSAGSRSRRMSCHGAC